MFFRCFSLVFLCKSMRVGEKKTQSAGKNTKFQYALQTLLALGAYSYERTQISFTVLDTPTNNNYCLVSHYSLLVGSNVIHVCFTGSLHLYVLNESSCFRFFPFFSPWVLSTRPLPRHALQTGCTVWYLSSMAAVIASGLLWPHTKQFFRYQHLAE